MPDAAPETARAGPPDLREFCQWDPKNWGRAIQLWDRELAGDWTGQRALEAGAGPGGMSLYLAYRGCDVVCTDRRLRFPDIQTLHARWGYSSQIAYANADITDLPFADRCFDRVLFKSLLGSVGRYGGGAAQRKALDEVRRILRPGGLLLFVENAKGSGFHDYCRRKFVPWGHDCRYVDLAEMKSHLELFSEVCLRTFGVLGAFGRSESQRSLLHYVDRLATPLVPATARYLMYGYARK